MGYHILRLNKNRQRKMKRKKIYWDDTRLPSPWDRSQERLQPASSLRRASSLQTCGWDRPRPSLIVTTRPCLIAVATRSLLHNGEIDQYRWRKVKIASRKERCFRLNEWKIREMERRMDSKSIQVNKENLHNYKIEYIIPVCSWIKQWVGI